MALVPMVSRSCELLVVTATDSLVVASGSESLATRISSWDGNIDGPKGPVCAEAAIRVAVTRAQLRFVPAYETPGGTPVHMEAIGHL